jgi:hypothetical protein
MLHFLLLLPIFHFVQHPCAAQIWVRICHMETQLQWRIRLNLKEFKEHLQRYVMADVLMARVPINMESC